METQVLIIGAGPTGLMLAHDLARRGVRALIVDRHGGPAEQTRAIGVQARTLEILAQAGLAAPAVARGARTAGANLWANGEHKARIPVGDIGRDLSPYPYILMLGQDETERLFNAALAEHGIAVRWRTELVQLIHHEDHVAATLRQPDGSQLEVRALWVAGCDGSRSSVRESCGIGFPGAPYEHTFFVADTVATGPMKPAELNVYLWRDGFHLFFPMRGVDRWRVIGILPPHLRERDEVELADVEPHVRAAVGARLEFKQCLWFSRYRIHHRRAERFRAGRCFLLGDAAHIHSPMGAQGMNTGLQDAYNLSWKLAAVLTQRAPSELLDTYAVEREPVAQRLLETTDRAFMFVVSKSWWAGLLRTRVIARIAARAMHFERVRRLAFRAVSQLGVAYPRSVLSRTLSGTTETSPRGGDRFPWLSVVFEPGGPAIDLFARLDDLHHHLLLVGQGARPDWLATLPAELGVHALPVQHGNAARFAAAGIVAPAFYVLRPDGHVAVCGAELDESAVTDYLAQVGRFTKQAVAAPPDRRFGTPVPHPRDRDQRHARLP
jgi:2-polyprenyl-6-methoxyphenol hydroxylase-like FAD-dependent oxidoreductase